MKQFSIFHLYSFKFCLLNNNKKTRKNQPFPIERFIVSLKARQKMVARLLRLRHLRPQLAKKKCAKKQKIIVKGGKQFSFVFKKTMFLQIYVFIIHKS